MADANYKMELDTIVFFIRYLNKCDSSYILSFKNGGNYPSKDVNWTYFIPLLNNWFISNYFWYLILLSAVDTHDSIQKLINTFSEKNNLKNSFKIFCFRLSFYFMIRKCIFPKKIINFFLLFNVFRYLCKDLLIFIVRQILIN